MYQKPTEMVIKAVGNDKKGRKVFHWQMKGKKMEVGREAKFERKNEIKVKVEATAEFA